MMERALHHQHPRSRRARPRFQSNCNIRYHPSSSICRSTRTRIRCRTIRTPCRSPYSSTRTRTRTEITAELFCNSYQMLAVCILFSDFLSATHAHAHALPLQHPHQPHTHLLLRAGGLGMSSGGPLPHTKAPAPGQAPGQAQAPASNNNSGSMAGGSSFKAGCPQES